MARSNRLTIERPAIIPRLTAPPAVTPPSKSSNSSRSDAELVSFSFCAFRHETKNPVEALNEVRKVGKVSPEPSNAAAIPAYAVSPLTLEAPPPTQPTTTVNEVIFLSPSPSPSPSAKEQRFAELIEDNLYRRTPPTSPISTPTTVIAESFVSMTLLPSMLRSTPPKQPNTTPLGKAEADAKTKQRKKATSLRRSLIKFVNRKTLKVWKDEQQALAQPDKQDQGRGRVISFRAPVFHEYRSRSSTLDSVEANQDMGSERNRTSSVDTTRGSSTSLSSILFASSRSLGTKRTSVDMFVSAEDIERELKGGKVPKKVGVWQQGRLFF